MKYRIISSLIIIILFASGVYAWTYTTPPASLLDSSGFKFGNTWISSTSLITDSATINLINGKNATYSCDYTYCVRNESGTYIAINGIDGTVEISNSSDAAPVINYVLEGSNRTIYIFPGTYLITSRQKLSGTGYIEIAYSDISIHADGVRFDILYTSDAVLQRGVEISSDKNNITIYGLYIRGNGICGTSTCYGLRSYGGSNVVFSGVVVENVKGFQITIESVVGEGGNNILLENCRLSGVGTNDVLGGGSLVRNMTVRNCYITQSLISGSYENAIDLVNISNLLIDDNIVIGGLVIGNEEGASQDVIIRDNDIYPAVLSAIGRIDFVTSLDENERFTIDNNRIHEGRFADIHGRNFTITNNKVIDQIANNDFYVNKSIITGNSFTGLVNNQYNNNLWTLNNFVSFADYGSSNSVIQNINKAPYNHGNVATAPTAFGAGDTYFDTDINKQCFYNSTGWAQIDDSVTACA